MTYVYQSISNDTHYMEPKEFDIIQLKMGTIIKIQKTENKIIGFN